MNIKKQELQFSERMQNVPSSFIREILKVAASTEVVSFAGGLPNPTCFPVEELKECSARVFDKHGYQVLQYAESAGYLPLRELIAENYSKHNVWVSPENILITNGSQQALDLIAKLFINPGDRIVVERPSYLGALQTFSVFQPDVHEVNLLDDGVDIEQLSRTLEDSPVKLMYAIPNFQNPTGISYSIEKRKKVAEVISNFNTVFVEDDPYGEIYFESDKLPPVYSYIPEQSILLGSFSKTIAPGLRLGWIVANSEIIKKATILKQSSDLHSGNLSQYLLAEFLTQHSYDDHLRRIRVLYRKQCEVMLSCIAEYFPETVSFTKPTGGMFTWLRLPEGVLSSPLLERAIKKNILFVPGYCFYASKPDFHTLRLNYSNVEEERMKAAMKTLANLI